MTAPARPSWPAMRVVEDLEGQADDRADRLHRAHLLIGAIEVWARPGNDPATAIVEIRRLIETHGRQVWLTPDPDLEQHRAAARATEDGESDG